MYKLILQALVFIVSFSGSSPLFSQTTGGPDPYGYIWRNSNDADTSAPEFNWIDITPPIGMGITGLADDNSTGWIELGFNFPYYWQEFNRVRIGSNGWIGFNNISNISHGFPFIPASGDGNENFLAPFLTDLTLATIDTSQPNPGRVYYWTNYKDIFIITWDSVPHWQPGAPQWFGYNTFQVVLDSTAKTILFQYEHVQPAPFQTTFIDAVVGIENITGNMGFGNYIDAIPPSDTFAIKYYAPDSTTAIIKDLRANWNLEEENGAQIVFRNQPVSVTSNISNIGTFTVPTFNAFGRIFDKYSNTVFSDGLVINSFQYGHDTTIQYTGSYTSVDTQTLMVENEISYSSDQNPSNNIKRTEVLVIDTTYNTFTLDFGKGAYTNNVLSWIGGDAGGGMYYKPPYYPMKITALEFYLVSIDTNDGFATQVILDDDSFGRPGTVVFSDSVEGVNVIPLSWHTVVLPSPLLIDSGGFYISWIMLGITPQLATTNTAPISNRTFEILNDTWEVYRDRSFIDFKMRPVIQGGCNVNPTVLAIGPLQFCEGDTSVTLTVPGGFENFQWSTGANTDSITVTQSGSYSATVSYNSGCGGNSNAVNVTVSPHPTPNLTANGPVLDIDILGSYQWYRNDTAIVGAVGQQYTATQTGTYHAVVIDANGCSGTSNSQFVFIEPGGIPGFYNSIHLNIFPNPVNDMLTVSIQKEIGSIATLTIHDLIGTEIQKEKTGSGKREATFKINTKPLKEGLYILKFEVGAQTHFRKLEVIH